MTDNTAIKNNIEFEQFCKFTELDDIVEYFNPKSVFVKLLKVNKFKNN